MHDGSPSHPQGTVLSGKPSGSRDIQLDFLRFSFTVSVGKLLLKEASAARSDCLIVNHGAALQFMFVQCLFFPNK